ncbi:hypothetical protein MtrunA17_Chr4g0021101 [Medicago truncatula]|uniref:Uncharacterized protein n=1 Tax=Medicago truncatula TaxID=3880 RepID=A0A396I5K4_MEDTR|nr:hypothetical protein MtrunA17_Chr4g0021101 [Medicago truncatula]
MISINHLASISISSEKPLHILAKNINFKINLLSNILQRNNNLALSVSNQHEIETSFIIKNINHSQTSPIHSNEPFRYNILKQIHLINPNLNPQRIPFRNHRNNLPRAIHVTLYEMPTHSSNRCY